MNTSHLYTGRLSLRPVITEDLDFIHELNSLEETARFNTGEIPKDLEETRTLCEKWMAENAKAENRSFIFTIELIDTKQFIGLIGMNLGKEKYRNAEVWFKFYPHSWNKGYGTEALKEMIAFGFNHLNLHRIEAGCATGNTGSVRVMEKAGMLREAHTRQLLPLPSGWADNYGYAILASDVHKGR
jgi:RimJ/RimL family protein N-acetyltransferase